jgi:hypothetical protein
MAEARKGKIARLPLPLRLEVNRRIRDGQTGSVICRWLNELPAAQTVMEQSFAGEPVKPQNLSEWRAGGYADWLREEGRVENVRRLADYAFSLAKAAGGNISEGAAAVAGGKILEMLEAAEGDQVLPLSVALAKLRDSDAKVSAAKTMRARLAQKDREIALAEKRFQRQTADLFLKWFDEEAARRIAEGRETKQVKMEKLITLMFGTPPAAAGQAAR